MQLPMFGEVGMDMRMVGTKVFVRLPEAISGGLTGGKEWVGVDVGKSLEQAGLGGLDFTQQQDPAQTLQYLRAASTGVTEAGSATVRGRRDDALHRPARFPQGARRRDRRAGASGGRASARQGGNGGGCSTSSATKGVPFEVFVDDDGLLRRMTMDMNMTIEGESMTMAMKMDYFDFGTDVNVQAPPASDVFDATGLLRP